MKRCVQTFDWCIYIHQSGITSWPLTGEDCFRASPKQQLLWGVPGLLWSVSIKEGTVVNQQQDRGWPHWCTRTVKAGPFGPIQQKSKLLKKLMLVLIERCQNTQCIAVCCLWECIATDKSGCPCWPLYTAESANNGHVSIRTGPWSNGRTWPGLMKHVYFYITWIACVSMCVAYLKNTRHQDSLCENGKLVEAVWCFGQCSAGKPWVLSSMWMLLWHVPST